MTLEVLYTIKMFDLNVSVFILRDTLSQCADLGTSSGHGIPQRREGEGCSSHFPDHVLCFPLLKEPQVTVVIGLISSKELIL